MEFGGDDRTKRSIKITMTKNDAPRATHRVIQAEVDSDDWRASRTGMASGGPARDANDCVPPRRGKTPAVDSLPTTRTKVLGGSSWTRSGGKLASEISGIDDGGRDSAPSGITRT
ncbi:MAG: hypothetical protein ACXVB5_17155, partial [Isosphaeraceae bacterium]